MNLGFITPQELGRLTHGQYNPRFRPCIRLPNGHLILAQAAERNHEAIRSRKGLQTAGENGYVMIIGA